MIGPPYGQNCSPECLMRRSQRSTALSQQSSDRTMLWQSVLLSTHEGRDVKALQHIYKLHTYDVYIFPLRITYIKLQWCYISAPTYRRGNLSLSLPPFLLSCRSSCFELFPPRTSQTLSLKLLLGDNMTNLNFRLA